jgi:hypothetical protein
MTLAASLKENLSTTMELKEKVGYPRGPVSLRITHRNRRYKHCKGNLGFPKAFFT